MAPQQRKSANNHVRLLDAIQHNDDVGFDTALRMATNVTQEDNILIRWAAQYGRTRMFHALRERGADYRAQGNAASSSAAGKGHTEIAVWLTRNGALHPDAIKMAEFGKFFETAAAIRAALAENTLGPVEAPARGGALPKDRRTSAAELR